MDGQREVPRPSLEMLLQANPDISVSQGRTGTVNIVKTLSADSSIHMSVVVNSGENGTNPELLVSAYPYRKGQQPEIYGIRNERSYISLKREGGKNLTAEYIYPKYDDLPRVEFDEMIRMTRAGLEIFDTYMSASSDERRKYQSRAYSWAAGRDLEADVNEMNPELAEMVKRSGYDLRTAIGQAKFAYMVLGRNPEIILKNSHPNTV